MVSPTPSAAERALEEIRQAIARGEIAPGSMVSENELAARVGVSRTPVRTALVRLQDEGWVTIYPQRGALVRQIGPEEGRHVAQARHAVEYASVRSLPDAERQALAATLTTLVEAQARRLADADLGRFVAADVEFHRALVVAGGNPVLLDFYDKLRQRQVLLTARRAASRQRAQRILDDHRLLADLVARGDMDGLDGALRDHLSAPELSAEGPTTGVAPGAGYREA